MSLSQVLALLLAISAAGNAAQGYLYLGQRDKAVVSATKEEHAVGVAMGCGKGVEELTEQADKRHLEAAPKIAAARQQAQQHNREADRILATPPAVPGNACASAQAVVDDWWRGRVKP